LKRNRPLLVPCPAERDFWNGKGRRNFGGKPRLFRLRLKEKGGRSFTERNEGGFLAGSGNVIAVPEKKQGRGGGRTFFTSEGEGEKEIRSVEGRGGLALRGGTTVLGGGGFGVGKKGSPHKGGEKGGFGVGRCIRSESVGKEKI